MEKDKIKMFFYIVFGGIAFISLVGLMGCNPQELNYQGKLRTVDQVEEMLADYLETENPDLDIEVTIITEID